MAGIPYRVSLTIDIGCLAATPGLLRQPFLTRRGANKRSGYSVTFMMGTLLLVHLWATSMQSRGLMAVTVRRSLTPTRTGDDSLMCNVITHNLLHHAICIDVALREGARLPLRRVPRAIPAAPLAVSASR